MENFNINSESKLKDKNFLTQLNKFYSTGKDGKFQGQNGISIYFNSFIQPEMVSEKGSILISTGRTEFSAKYSEVIYDIYNHGYSVYIVDHRGQGLSERIYKHDTELGHIDSFENYVLDLKTFYENYILPAGHKNIFLLGHSLGAAISLYYLEKFPNDFKAAAITSPMLGFDFPNCALIKLFKLNSMKYAMGHSNFINSIDIFSKNNLTTSQIRYELFLDLFKRFPEVKMGGPSYNWVYESCKAMKDIFRLMNYINIPLISFMGTEEEVVSIKAYNKFILKLKQLGKHIESVTIQCAKHELLMEKDCYRKEVLAKIFSFFMNAKDSR